MIHQSHPSECGLDVIKGGSPLELQQCIIVFVVSGCCHILLFWMQYQSLFFASKKDIKVIEELHYPLTLLGVNEIYRVLRRI
mmetsp:Transcript_7883/g.9578  ORF Transcript_7883/g.9578 Transcript_7883/m.9578 type:complete len:82 (+) Transcript_7883:956-1201(+)